MEHRFSWVARLKGKNPQNGAVPSAYLSILMNNGQVSQGGNQSWWTRPKDDPKSRRFDKDDRISRIGCGVIAMSNIELFLRPQSEEFRMTKEDYQKLVEENFQRRYRIKANPLNLMVGLYPWKMERELSHFLEENGYAWTKVKWAPYWKKGRDEQSMLVLRTIQEMLAMGYPVVCAYHTFDKKQPLILHKSPNGAANLEEESSDTRIISHYMTMIGVLHDEETEKYILQMESWGRIYYVAYEQYAAKLNYFSNILCIRE